MVAATACAASPDAQAPFAELDDCLVLPAVGEYGRMPLHRDPVESLLVQGTWQTPAAGDKINTTGDRTRSWRGETARNGQLDARSFRGGYVLWTVESPQEQTLLLHAKGHAVVFVNGVPRAGDPYQLGWLRLPVLLRAGRNELLFHVAGDELSARLVYADCTTGLDAADATFPTLVRGETEAVWGAVPVVNATNEALFGARIVCTHADGSSLATPLTVLPAASVFKAPFQIPAPAQDADDHATYSISLMRAAADGSTVDLQEGEQPAEVKCAEISARLEIVEPQEMHLRTFRSSIDESVQHYAVRPAAPSGEPHAPVLLALHDVGIACDDFARKFADLDWAHVVAPTGRRPHGFDWEDWSRVDALEALADAQRHYATDTRRTLLVGQGMGGHGVWHLGTLYPHAFHAVAPVAAWASYWSYGGGIPAAGEGDIEQMLMRAYAPSDTIKHLGNLGQTSVCVLHADSDPNVPIAQARFMRDRLADFHPNFAYLEVAESTDRLVALPQLAGILRGALARELPANDTIDLTIAHPGVAHGNDWVSIETQIDQLQPSRLVARRTLPGRRIDVKTLNVARFALNLAEFEPSRAIEVRIDGGPPQRVRLTGDEFQVWFEHFEGIWEDIGRPPLAEKGPHRYGTLKTVFDHRPLLVYGTRGDEEENAWAQSKARFDAETFWYRGNGTLQMLPDHDFRADDHPQRSVILYGNADTNSAWPVLLSTCPVQVRRGRAEVGVRPETGDDLAVMFVRPRSGSSRALVGVVGGTGPVGMRLTSRLRYFVGGVAYPDLLIFGPNVLTNGTDDVRAAGYFGTDWSVETGEIEWRDVAL